MKGIPFSPNVILMTLSRFLQTGYKQKNFRKVFTLDFLKKDIKDKKKIIVFSVITYPTPKIKLYFTKNNLTCSTFQNSYFVKFLQ